MKYRVCHLSFPDKDELEPKIVEAQNEVEALKLAYPTRVPYLDFEKIWAEGNGKAVRVDEYA